MEDLLLHLSQAQNQDENVQRELYEYTCASIQKMEFGPIILESLERDLPNDMLIILIGLLRSWAIRNWDNFSLESKREFFERLKNFIIQNHRFSLNVSNIFIDIAKKEICDSHIFEPIIFEIFKNIQLFQDINHLLAMMNLIGYMAKRFKITRENSACEMSLALQKIIDTTFIFFENMDLLQTNEGCEIMKLVLSSFSLFFLKCRAHFECAIAPLNYVRDVISLFIQQRINVKNVCFIGYCLRFYGKFINIFESMNFISEQIPCISQLINNLLFLMLENFENNSYVIGTILETIISLDDKIDINNDFFNLILKATKLTQQDIDNFEDNPVVYYSEIYSKKCSSSDRLHPRILSREIISNLLEKSQEFAMFLLKLQPQEHILRCISFSIHIYEQYEMIPQVLDFLKQIFSIDSSPEFTIAKLDLIKSCVPYFDQETRLSLVNPIPSLLNTNNSLIQIFASKLLKNLMKYGVIPDKNFSQLLLNLLPECPTNHISKTLNLMVKVVPDIILPQSENVIIMLLEKIKNEILLLDSDDLDASEKANEDIEQDFILISQIIDSGGKDLIVPEMLNIIRDFFNQEDAEVLSYVIPLYSSILCSGSQYIPYFFNIFFESFQNNTKLFVDNFDDIFLPIFSFISKFPKVFLELKISDTLIHLLASIFENPNSYEIIFVLSELISWIIQVDPNVDITPVLELASILNMDEYDLPPKICSMNIYASCYVMKFIKPDYQIINEMIDSIHFCFQKYQKHLFAFLFLYLATYEQTNSDNFVKLSFKLINEEFMMKQMDEKQIQDYFNSLNYPCDISTLAIEIPYSSPIEQRDYNEIISLSLQKCSNDTVQQLREQYPSFF